MSDTWTIYTDGGSRGNPGLAAYAYIIQRPGLSDIEEKACLTEPATNNIAEYLGLVRGLEHALHEGGSHVEVLSDSELMVKQLNGEYRVKHPGLIPLYEQAKGLSESFDSFEIRHIRREHNKRADKLCNEAMDHPQDNMPFPVALPAKAKPVAALPAKATPQAADELRSRAVAILKECGTPDPEATWDRLWQMLAKAKAVRRKRRRSEPEA